MDLDCKRIKRKQNLTFNFIIKEIFIMAVPSSNSHLVNAVGGSYGGQTQGGTVLGNTSTTSGVITKAFPLIDTAVGEPLSTGPKAIANGIVANQKIVSGGAFAYEAAGQYVIRTVSNSIAGVASTAVLIPGSDTQRRPIAQFEHDYGAKLLTLWRGNRFSWLGIKADGSKLGTRYNWTAAITSGGGNVVAASLPTLSTTNMVNPVGGGSGYRTDSAANPTRTIPGELVMKVDFVDTSVATGGDFFDYKPITG
jgi:hypothetical protein